MSAPTGTTSTTWNHSTHYHPLVLDLVRPGDRAVDVGCGEGLLTRELVAAGAASALGVDASEEMVQEARRLVPADAAGRLAYVAGDALAPLPDPHTGPFDIVTCVATLHHLPLEDGLRRLRELTAPGGRLLVIGLARPSGADELALSLASVVAHRVAVARRGYWEHPAPVADYSHSTAEVRAAAARILPGSVLRPRLYWRYTLQWTAPPE